MNAAQIPELVLGEPLEFELAPGEAHSYRVEAYADEFIHIVVEQRGIDVVATLLDPDDGVLVQSDRAINGVGPEPLLALAKLNESYRLRVEATVSVSKATREMRCSGRRASRCVV